MQETFPTFFAQAPTVRVRDPLARFLGAAAGGILEYHYADAVRLAGHSCPTRPAVSERGRLAPLPPGRAEWGALRPMSLV